MAFWMVARELLGGCYGVFILDVCLLISYCLKGIFFFPVCKSDHFKKKVNTKCCMIFRCSRCKLCVAVEAVVIKSLNLL